MAHRLAPEAEKDLEDIAFYVFVQSGRIEIAYRLIESITERFALLGRHPYAGRQRDDLRPGLRSFSVGDYILVYRVDGKDALIDRVVHGSRDLESLLGD